MILPLPDILMDFFITINISLSIVILVVSLQLSAPVHFSTFPSLLLLTTLFRLSISISTTRLILTQGSAGQIVETFGDVVISGNLIVGLVIFLIITIVQFLVITKGADRVAEVGARFTLDGMPGKQMSVDADVRAGSLDYLDALEARRRLEKEAKLFGSMDGALKFVKGDAIAGLVITIINLVGGIAIGMLQRDMPFSEALKLYSLMTVGDGLVAQIPALLISVAAGNMVTRVADHRGVDLGFEISEQITQNPRTLSVAALTIIAFGFIPGFPFLLFAIVGGAILAGSQWHLRSSNQLANLASTDWLKIQKVNAKTCDEIQQRTGRLETLMLTLPPTIKSTDAIAFAATFDSIRTSVAQELGLPTGFWRFEIDESAQNDYKISINQEFLVRGEFIGSSVFVKANPSYLQTLDIVCKSHYGAREGAVVADSFVPILKHEGIPYWNATELMLRHIKVAIAENAVRFASLENVSDLLNRTRPNHKVLVTDVTEALSLNTICVIIKNFCRERLPLTSLVRILEEALAWASHNPEPSFLTQKIRIALADFLTNRFAPDGFLPVILTSPTIEGYLRDGVRKTDEGNFLLLEPSIAELLKTGIKSIIGESYQRNKHPVIITQQDVRPLLFSVLHENGIFIPVLAYQEILPGTVIYPVSVLMDE
nr:flagellar biosynthesis protein FlhA [Ochrobactrum sp. Marseille-Q0166]